MLGHFAVPWRGHLVYAVLNTASCSESYRESPESIPIPKWLCPCDHANLHANLHGTARADALKSDTSLWAPISDKRDFARSPHLDLILLFLLVACT